MSLGNTKAFGGAEEARRAFSSIQDTEYTHTHTHTHTHTRSIMRSILKYVLKRQLTNTGIFDDFVSMIIDIQFSMKNTLGLQLKDNQRKLIFVTMTANIDLSQETF